MRIILSGVAVNSVLGGYNAFLQLQNSDNLSGVLAFMNGSLSGGNWTKASVCAVYASIGLFLSFLSIRNANALQLGDEMAKNLGIRVNLSRIVLSAISAFLAAATVAEVGMIGFVGLCAPHISRMLVGSDYKVMLPTSVLTGALMVLAADTLGRSLIPGHGNSRGRDDERVRRPVLPVYAQKERKIQWHLRRVKFKSAMASTWWWREWTSPLSGEKSPP